MCPSEAHRGDGCGFGLERQIGEHRSHGRLVGERCAEGCTMTGVPGGFGHRLPHTGGAAEHAVESRLCDHLDDRPYTAARLADHQGDGAVEFNLARRVGLVAELVLEALDAERVAGAVGQDSGEEEARESLSASTFRLSEDEERVGHRCRAEPLVTGQQVLRARAARTDRPGDGGVGTDVGAALLLGHRHAEDRRGFVCGQARRIAARQRLWNPLGGDVGLQFQRGDDRVGHRHRASVARLDLPEEHKDRRAGDVRTRLRVGPTAGVRTVLDCRGDDPVIARVVLHLVDPVAPAVKGVQFGRDGVGKLGVVLELRAADEHAHVGEFACGPGGIVAVDGLDEHGVELVLIDVDPRGRLVEHRVRHVRPRLRGRGG